MARAGRVEEGRPDPLGAQSIPGALQDGAECFTSRAVGSRAGPGRPKPLEALWVLRGLKRLRGTSALRYLGNPKRRTYTKTRPRGESPLAALLEAVKRLRVDGRERSAGTNAPWRSRQSRWAAAAVPLGQQA
jgi:hypothetical protein